MKTKTLCSVALLTLLGVSLATPAVANAEAKSLPTNGKIKFTEDNGQKTSLTQKIQKNQL